MEKNRSVTLHRLGTAPRVLKFGKCSVSPDDKSKLIVNDVISSQFCPKQGSTRVSCSIFNSISYHSCTLHDTAGLFCWQVARATHANFSHQLNFIFYCFDFYQTPRTKFFVQSDMMCQSSYPMITLCIAHLLQKCVEYANWNAGRPFWNKKFNPKL